MYGEKLREMAGDEPFSVEKLIEFSLQSIPEPPADAPDPLDGAKAQASQFLGPVDEKLAAARRQYDAFFAAFERQATDGQLPKAKCVEIATGCILEVPRSPPPHPLSPQ